MHALSPSGLHSQCRLLQYQQRGFSSESSAARHDILKRVASGQESALVIPKL